MKKIVLASVIGLSLIFTGCAKISSMRAGVQIKSAQKYLLSEDYEKAIVRLKQSYCYGSEECRGTSFAGRGISKV